MKILFFGDIVGQIGRRAIKKILPTLKEEVAPDLILANVENLAHGVGVTEKTLQELTEAGIDFFTSGNHIFDKPEAEKLLNQKDSKLIRPANYPPTVAGTGFKIVEVGSRRILIINLMGRVFVKENFDCPFRKVDEILEKVNPRHLAGIIIDFHAEATSEKVAFGHYLDGRVSAILGTHTHVPTADAKILAQGTAYVTDIGMVGAADSVIGVKKEPVINTFLTQTPGLFETAPEGEVEVDAMVLEIDPKTKKAISLSRLDKKIEV